MESSIGKAGVRSNVLLVLLWTVTCVWSVSSAVSIYVSPAGNDSNDGRSVDKPIQTLQHAVEMLNVDGIRGQSVFVELMAGYHDLADTLKINLTSAPVVFRAYQGQEVHVTGGRRLASDKFVPVTDASIRERLPPEARDKVLELDLIRAGMTDLGTLTPYGFAISWTAPLEISINGRPLTLAEWPNGKFTSILSVPGGKNGTTLTYDAGGRDALWTQEAEPWTYGWWYWSWADLSAAVTRVDPATHTLTLRDRTRYGLRTGHYNASSDNRHWGYDQQGGYFRVINMLCEIDTPGEYYIDRKNKKLYLWPNTPQQTLTSSDVVYGSLIDDCFQLGPGAPGVTLQDFTLEACRAGGVQLLDQVRDVTLQNLEIRDTGGAAVYTTGDVRAVSVVANDIHDVNGGVHIGGGDRVTLTASENVIRDNHIWAHSRVGAVPNHGISVGGVKVNVSHNHVHHGTYAAVWWGGNDHVFEYNHIHHECWNASDCGAFHTGRDWTFRGNVIRKNMIHDCVRVVPGADVRGIMLDDQYAAVLIEANVFYNNDLHANIGGGRDNVVRENVMYNALQWSMQVDGRGLEPGPGNKKTLMDSLTASPYQTPLWKSRYPKLFDILDGNPNAPQGNAIMRNVVYDALGIEFVNWHGDGLNRTDYYNVSDNFMADADSDFVSPDNYDFRLAGQAAQWGASVFFPTPVTLNDVGPTVPTGPHYLRDNKRAESTAP